MAPTYRYSILNWYCGTIQIPSTQSKYGLDPMLDPTSKEDRYSARIYIERSYRDLGNRRSEYNYILHYLEQSRKKPKCTKVRFPRLRVRTCTLRAPTRTQVLVPVQAFRSNSSIRTVPRTRLQVLWWSASTTCESRKSITKMIRSRNNI